MQLYHWRNLKRVKKSRRYAFTEGLITRERLLLCLKHHLVYIRCATYITVRYTCLRYMNCNNDCIPLRAIIWRERHQNNLLLLNAHRSSGRRELRSTTTRAIRAESAPRVCATSRFTTRRPRSLSFPIECFSTRIIAVIPSRTRIAYRHTTVDVHRTRYRVVTTVVYVCIYVYTATRLPRIRSRQWWTCKNHTGAKNLSTRSLPYSFYMIPDRCHGLAENSFNFLISAEFRWSNCWRTQFFKFCSLQFWMIKRINIF